MPPHDGLRPPVPGQSGQDEWARGGFGHQVIPPTRQRRTAAQLAGSALISLVLVSGLVLAVLVAMPALDVTHQSAPAVPGAVQGY